MSQKIPNMSPGNQHFWDELKKGYLTTTYCRKCNNYLWYPRKVCSCGSLTEWKKLSGKGEVYSFSEVNRATDPWYQERTPYILAVVQLEEDFLIMGHIDLKENQSIDLNKKVEFTCNDEATVLPITFQLMEE